MVTIIGGDMPVHPTRLPMSWSALQVLLNDIPKSFKLAVGQNGGWSAVAN